VYDDGSLLSKRPNARCGRPGWISAATLLSTCDRLSGDQLTARSVPPSGLSPSGLVRHLTEVERNWFRRTLAVEAVGAVYSAEAHVDGDFSGAGTADRAGDLQLPR
jgi:hypothetical protein